MLDCVCVCVFVFMFVCLFLLCDDIIVCVAFVKCSLYVLFSPGEIFGQICVLTLWALYQCWTRVEERGIWYGIPIRNYTMYAVLPLKLIGMTFLGYLS